MKKQNRRTKQTSVVDSSSSAVDDKELHEKRVHELEMQNDTLKREVEDLRYRLANVSSPDVIQKLEEVHLQKINSLEEQVLDLKKKLEVQAQLSIRKAKIDDSAKSFQDEIQRLRAKKVQLQCKAKLDSVQFRLSKASMQKEILQLKKQNRRIEFEKHLLLALNQRQKSVLQRKNKEALSATKRLTQFLESRKALTSRTAGALKGNHSQFQQSIEHELDVTVQVQQVCSEYEREMEEMADVIEKLKLEAEALKEENSSCLRCQLEDNEDNLRVKDSELSDLKEEVTRLSSIVGQMATPKTEVIQHETQVDVIQSSSVGNSISLLDMNTSELELSEGVIAANRVCCSCSKKSLCKTSKCGCRAAGGSCGTTCGCEASKCTNRESGTHETEKSNDSASQDMMSPIEPEVKDNCDPRRQPLKEIGNDQNNLSKAGKRKKGRKPVTERDSNNGSRKAGKIAE